MNRRFSQSVPAAALLCFVWGCGSSHGPGATTEDAAAGSDGGSGACATIGPSVTSTVPHVETSDARAQAVTQALGAILAAQTPALAPAAQTYVIPSIACRNLQSPFPSAPSGYGCTFSIRVDGGASVAITLSPPSALAAAFFNALVAAGAQACTNDPHGPSVTLANFKATIATADDVQFDDESMYTPIPTPNVAVEGADASGLLAAFATAQIDDCDPTRSAFLICNTYGGAPGCGYQWTLLDSIGGSELVYSCGPASSPMKQGATLDAPASLAIWQAIVTAATDTDFKPLDGTPAQATVVNASYFRWDGSNLGFTLVMDNATPPPPPGNDE